jgi:site-specific DNA-methyltransferase (adenine-specific)
MLDRQSGQSTSRAGKPRASAETGSFLSGLNAVGAEHNDTGGASRFFYCPKASKKERDAGLEDLEEKRGGPEQLSAAARDGVGEQRMIMRRNTHPTVKPLKLCQYLCRLITPPSGLVLDPFMGSGSTGVAAIVEGFRFIGVEQNEDYCAIASRRMSEAALGAVA